MTRRASSALLLALISAPALAGPVEMAPLVDSPIASVPAMAPVAPEPMNAASVQTFAAPFAVAPAAAAPVSAAPAPAQVLPSARAQAGVAARVAQVARSWGAPIEKIFAGHDVLVYGENHSSLESVQTLTREMPRLAKAGVKAIGIEGLKRPHQAAVDAYVSRRSDVIPFDALNFSPRRVKAFAALLGAAREHGVRVVALGVPLEFWAEQTAVRAAANTGRPIADFTGSTNAQFKRAQALYEPGYNEAVAQVYLTDRNHAMAEFLAQAIGVGGKAVVLVGQAHVDGLDMIPGALLNAPGNWGTLADALTRRALRAFSLTQTGGKFVDENDEADDRRARPQSYRAGDHAAPNGAPVFVPLGSDRGLWHAGRAPLDPRGAFR